MDARSPIYPGQYVRAVPKQAERGMFDSFGTPRTGEILKITGVKVATDATFQLELANHPDYWFSAIHFELVDGPGAGKEKPQDGSS